MKKLLLSGLLVALATSVFAQGQLYVDNTANVNTSPTATTGGLFFLDSDGAGGNPAVLINSDFNLDFYGGTDSANLSLLKSIVNQVGSSAGAGLFSDPSGAAVTLPGGTTTGFFRIDAWVGGAGSTYAAAAIKGQSSVFSNPVAVPPSFPTTLTGMPAITLTTIVPEPGTFALAGLGAAALLIFRRRK